jgi:hypothetical protein
MTTGQVKYKTSDEVDFVIIGSGAAFEGYLRDQVSELRAKKKGQPDTNDARGSAQHQAFREHLTYETHSTGA